MTLANSARMQKLLAQTKAIKASKIDDIANNTGKVSTAGKNVIDKADDIAKTGGNTAQRVNLGLDRSNPLFGVRTFRKCIKARSISCIS